MKLLVTAEFHRTTKELDFAKPKTKVFILCCLYSLCREVCITDADFENDFIDFRVSEPNTFSSPEPFDDSIPF